MAYSYGKKNKWLKGVLFTLIGLLLTVALTFGIILLIYNQKYNVNVVESLIDIKSMPALSQNDLRLDNTFTNQDLLSINQKIDKADFSENAIFFEDKEIGAYMANHLAVEEDALFSFELLQFKLINEDTQSSNLLTTFDFVVKLNISKLKQSKMSSFPSSIIGKRLPDELYMSIKVSVITDEEKGYKVEYVSNSCNGLTAQKTENAFGFIGTIVKDLDAKHIAEMFGQVIADGLIGDENTLGIYKKLTNSGAKSYDFEQYNEKNYFVVFSVNGNEQRNITYICDKDVPNTNKTTYKINDGEIKLKDLTSPGYKFLGWYNQSDEKIDTIYSYKFVDYVLQAKWEIINYNITYDLFGGVVGGDNPTSYNILSDDFTIINPTKDFADFIGWMINDSEDIVPTVTIKKGSVGDLKLTAIFEGETTLLTFVVDGVSVYNQDVEKGTILTKDKINNYYTDEKVGMTGYIVNEWYEDENCNIVFDYNTVLTQRTKIYGKSSYIVDSLLNVNDLARFNSARNLGNLKVSNHEELVKWAFYVWYFDIANDIVDLDLSNYISLSKEAIGNELNSAVGEVASRSSFTSITSIQLYYTSKIARLNVVNNENKQLPSKTFESSGSILSQQDSAIYQTYTQVRDDSFDNFNINKVANTINVYTTNQLVYALEMGYRPICEKDSPAEVYYNQAKNVLRRICDDSMTNQEKLFQIYTWIVLNTNYDYYAANQANIEYFVVNELKKYDSWYIEGVFNNHKAVCEGYAKAFTLLARIENIPCVMEIGNKHEWNKVYLNGKWYGIDSTHGDAHIDRTNMESLSLAQFLFTDEEKENDNYIGTYYRNLKADTNYNMFENFVLEYNDKTFNLVIDSKEELDLLFKYIKNREQIIESTYVSLEIILSNSLSVSDVQTIAYNNDISIAPYYSSDTYNGEKLYTFFLNYD